MPTGTKEVKIANKEGKVVIRKKIKYPSKWYKEFLQETQ